MSTFITARRRHRRASAGLAVVAAATAALAAGMGPANASSHREAPLIAGDPKVDNTDVYAFVSPDDADTVTLIANWLPFQEPNGGPNFYPWQTSARYDINIDNDGDAKADITYRWTFSDADRRGNNTFLYNNGPVDSIAADDNLLFKQAYALTEIRGSSKKVVARGWAAPSVSGKASVPDAAALRHEATTNVFGGGKTFAGPADDSFFLDLRVFDLLYGGDLSQVGQDTLAGYNVNTVALQVPKSKLALKGNASRNPVIGIWSSTAKKSMVLTPGAATPKGAYVQVSRLGNPLVNEVVVPAGLKNAFNGIAPHVDASVAPVVQRVTDPELPKLVEGIYGIDAPATPRNDLVEIFLTGIGKHAPTLDGSAPPIQADLNAHVLNADVDAAKFRPSEMLRLNMGVAPAASPNRLGVIGGDLQGFPNGRRLADDVLDIAVQAVEGAAQSGQIVQALATGDQVNANDKSFGGSFPYVALPNTSSVNEAGGAGALPGPVGRGGDRPFPGLPSPDPVLVGTLGMLLTAAGGVLLLGRRRRGTHAAA